MVIIETVLHTYYCLLIGLNHEHPTIPYHCSGGSQFRLDVALGIYKYKTSLMRSCSYLCLFISVFKEASILKKLNQISDSQNLIHCRHIKNQKHHPYNQKKDFFKK